MKAPISALRDIQLMLIEVLCDKVSKLVDLYQLGGTETNEGVAVGRLYTRTIVVLRGIN